MVKQGYKQTEIGVIPEDWVCTTWESVGDGFTSGATPYRAIKSFYKGNLKWVTSGELNYNTIYETIEHISDEARIRTNLKIHPKDTFLMAITGLEAAGTRGSCAILGTPATTNQSCMAIYPTDKLDTKYLFYYYSKYGDDLAFKYCQGTKQQSYTAKIVKILPIIIPQIEEQKVIAEALSDVDGMISSLEKLIAKKKAVKQGAMQELLTGNKRLSGYTGNWKKYKLDDLLKYEQPTNYIVHNTEYVEQGVPVLTAGKSLLLGYTNESDGIYENLPVIIFDDFVTSSKYITYKFKVKSSAMKMLTLKNDKMSLRLIFELMQMIDFKPYDHQRHWISQYSQFEIYLPEEVEEQNAIASILSDMDNEIEALEQKLAKTRQLKQGMMQQLLTGKIRLV